MRDASSIFTGQYVTVITPGYTLGAARKKGGWGRYSGSAHPREPRRPSSCTSHPVAGQRQRRSFLEFPAFSYFHRVCMSDSAACRPHTACVRVSGDATWAGGRGSGAVVSGFPSMSAGIQSFRHREWASCSPAAVRLIPPLSGPRTAAASRSCSLSWAFIFVNMYKITAHAI